MIYRFIDQTYLVIRRLKLVEMAIEGVEDRDQAAALHEGVQVTSDALAELKRMLDEAHSIEE